MAPIGAARANLSRVPSFIPDSGVSRYTFDDADTDGSTLVDAWGANDATNNGASTGVNGANQTYDTAEAYSFDGTDDYLDTNHVFNLDQHSTAVWVLVDTFTDIDRVYDDNDGTGGSFIKLTSNNSFEFNIRDGSSNGVSATTTTGLNTGQWYHVVGVYDGSEIAIYLDGSQEATTSVSTHTNAQVERNFAENYNPDGRLLNGDLDDARIYNKGLTATEVSDLYNNGSI